MFIWIYGYIFRLHINNFDIDIKMYNQGFTFTFQNVKCILLNCKQCGACLFFYVCKFAILNAKVCEL